MVINLENKQKEMEIQEFWNGKGNPDLIKLFLPKMAFIESTW